MIKVIIVDDHQIFVDGVASLIEDMENVSVVGTANNGVELIDLLHKVSADVILMDVNMPKMDGLASTTYVDEHFKNIGVLILSMHDSGSYIEKLLKAGANGYVLKNTKKSELEEAIHTIADGKTYYSAEVTARIMENLQKRKSTKKAFGDVKLTAREKDVLQLIVKEHTTNEIAEQLFISHHTVESHRKNLIAKLNVRGTSGLVKYAIQSGLAE